MLSIEISSTIFSDFGMTRRGIEPWSPGPLANTLPNRQCASFFFLNSRYTSNTLTDTLKNINLSLRAKLIDMPLILFKENARADIVGCFLWHINHCRYFNDKSSLYIYIKYIGFSLVGFYGISTIVIYLMPNLLYTYILNIWFGLVGFYGISTIVGYLMPNPLNIYILNI